MSVYQSKINGNHNYGPNDIMTLCYQWLIRDFLAWMGEVIRNNIFCEKERQKASHFQVHQGI